MAERRGIRKWDMKRTYELGHQYVQALNEAERLEDAGATRAADQRREWAANIRMVMVRGVGAEVTEATILQCWKRWG